MRKLAFLFGLVLITGLVFLIPACGGDQQDNDTRGLDTENDGTHAKDMPSGLTCADSEVLITDCYDACSCCSTHDSEEYADPMEGCIWSCDNLIEKVNDLEFYSKADLVNYKECVVGCYSICEKPDKDVNCYNECAHYLGL